MKKVSMFKKAALVIALAAAGITAAPAFADTSMGTITVIGAAVVSCTLNSPVIDFGAVDGGTSPVRSVAIRVKCTTGTPWSLSSANAGGLSVGADGGSNNMLALETLAGVNVDSVNPVTGTATGGYDSQSLQIVATAADGVSGLVGRGVLSGVLQTTLAY